jgi:hypothetical protein
LPLSPSTFKIAQKGTGFRNDDPLYCALLYGASKPSDEKQREK